MLPGEADTLIARTLAEVRAGEAHMWHVLSRSLASGQTLDPTGWAASKHAEMARVRSELETISRRLAAGVRAEGTKALGAAHAAGWGTAVTGGQVSGAYGLSTVRLGVLVAETMSVFESMVPSVLRSVDDVYRRTVSTTVARVIDGTQTVETALDATIRQFAARGIGGFVDRAGRHWTLDAYADMTLRTAAVRSSAAGVADSVTARGRDLVVVSDSPEECPLCRPWERQVLSITGATGQYPSLDTATIAGLFHPNCTHTIAPFVEGLSRPGRADANPDGYEERQQQRYLERGIRGWQRQEIAATSDTGRAEARAKVREWQARHRGFLDETGRRRDSRATLPRAEVVRLAR